MANITVLPPNQPSCRVDLVPLTSGTTAATYTTSAITGVAAYKSAVVQVTTANLTGSLAVYIQHLLPDGSTWDDFASFTAISTNTTKVFPLVYTGGTADYAKADGALSAGSRVAGPLGSAWRVKYVVTTGPIDILIAAEFFA